MSYVKMNEKRIDLVKAVREEFGKDRVHVTRRELQSIVDVEPRVHSWPTWLVNKDVLKIERGLYHLPDNNGMYRWVMGFIYSSIKSKCFTKFS